MGKSLPVNPFVPGPGAGTVCPGLAEPGSAAHRITESQNHRITESPRREAAGSGCSAHLRLSHSFEGFGKRRFGFVSCFLAASACLVWPPVFCDMKALAINTPPHVSEGFVVFSCPCSSSLWEGQELGGARGAGSGDASGAAPCPGQPSVHGSEHEAAGPSRTLLDLQMFIAADKAAPALCTRGRGGFCSSELVTSPGSRSWGCAGPLGQPAEVLHPEGLWHRSFLGVPNTAGTCGVQIGSQGPPRGRCPRLALPMLLPWPGQNATERPLCGKHALRRVNMCTVAAQ